MILFIMNFVDISTIDFNKQLFALLDENKKIDDNNLCLITNKQLEEDCVELICGHKFNYEPIFNEIKRQKTFHNSLEVTRLKKDEIKCPYCRKIQKGLLIHNERFPKINKVNWPENMQLLPNKCSYCFVSGKKKGESCGKRCAKDFCLSHKKIMEKRELKKLEKEKKQLLIEQKKLLKQKEKIQNEGIKLQNYFNNLLEASQNTKTLNDDNTINTINKMLQKINEEQKTCVFSCKYVYKRGKNKGLQCTCKKIFKDGFCRLHWKQYNKKNEINKINNINKKISHNEKITITI